MSVCVCVWCVVSVCGGVAGCVCGVSGVSGVCVCVCGVCGVGVCVYTCIKATCTDKKHKLEGFLLPKEAH